MLEKTVKVSDPGLIQFFYPNIVVRDELTIMDRENEVLYVGKMRPKFKQYLTIGCKHYISVVGAVDVDYTNSEILVKWVYNKRGKEPPSTVLEMVKNIDLSYTEYLCKIYYLTGHWIAKADNIEESLFTLFQATVGSTKDLLSVYFKLREVYPYEVIQASVLTFLSRVMTIQDQSVSPSYMMLLKQAYQRYGTKIRGVVLWFVS